MTSVQQKKMGRPHIYPVCSTRQEASVESNRRMYAKIRKPIIEKSMQEIKEHLTILLEKLNDLPYDYKRIKRMHIYTTKCINIFPIISGTLVEE